MAVLFPFPKEPFEFKKPTKPASRTSLRTSSLEDEGLRQEPATTLLVCNISVVSVFSLEIEIPVPEYCGANYYAQTWDQLSQKWQESLKSQKYC